MRHCNNEEVLFIAEHLTHERDNGPSVRKDRRKVNGGMGQIHDSMYVQVWQRRPIVDGLPIDNDKGVEVVFVSIYKACDCKVCRDVTTRVDIFLGCGG